MKKILTTIIVCSLILSMAACGKNAALAPTEAPEAVVTEAPAAEETAAPEEVSAYPVTLIDQAGRSVVIEKEPESLVSGYYISTSLLIALELDDRMVGIEAAAEKRKLYKLAAQDLIDLPSVGSAKEFDLEGCAALKPDLAILPMKLKDAAAKLEELEITTLLVNPENEELLFEMIDLIAAAADRGEKAEELKSFINDQKAMLQDKVGAAEAKRVYLAGNSDLLSTAGSKMYQNSMIELAGGENVAADIEDNYWADVDYEQILAWNPDYIILAADAKYTVDDVLKDEALAECSAVVNEQVYQIPSAAESWDSPVPGSILGSVWLANVLHPEEVSEEECDRIIEEFYETFYGFTYPAK